MSWRFNCLAILLLLPGLTGAQILNPVKWTSRVEQHNEKEATLYIQPVMEKGWHIYGQTLPDEGPIPTEIIFERTTDYDLIGRLTETGAKKEMDPIWGFEVTYLSDGAFFSQKIKIRNPAPFWIKATVNYQACDESKCLPPDDVTLLFAINEGKSTVAMPEETLTVSAAGHDSVISKDKNITEPAVMLDYSMLEQECGETAGAVEEYTSLRGIFIGGVLGGLIALLTPCVFPMIPLTVSFFTKRSSTRRKGIMNAVVYALSIIVIYVGLGLFVTITLGSDALNELASNAFFNLAFFFIFLIFAISFFGAFDIVLPGTWVTKADKASERGGIIGIFFMAFTLSLVSFSCTGPIIGTLLVEAALGRSYLGPLSGMAGFALALALPFALFAAFPGWLQSLPRSGGWLNTVKISLGFIELALALKFLSNVDLAYHWGILQRELFLTLWIVIFGLMGIYLLGGLKFKHDSEVQHIGIPRLLIAILTLSFTLYLIPGLWGAPLKLISGFPPPDFYREWISGHTATHCPHNLNCFHDYEEGMRYARAKNKPVMLDFTGWSCVNCRKMEDNVWSDPRILKKLRDDYVIISLYVDDKTPLPEEERYDSKVTGKKIKTVGNKWSDMQASWFNTNSQPYYVLLDHQNRPLARPRGYTPEVEMFNRFLEEGLCRFRKRNLN